MSWMKIAFELAKKARTANEVPVGAVIVDSQQNVVARAYNEKEGLQSPLGHAEILAIHRAAKKKGTWRLSDCTMYVTHEPCAMCQRVAQEARLGKIVYASKASKPLAADHFPLILKQELEFELQSSQMLSDFFAGQRPSDKGQFRERTSAIIFHQQKILGFDAIDPMSKTPYFFLPGGGIEGSETLIESCHRELKEECNVEAQLFLASHFQKDYIFHWDGIKYHSRTHFFVGELKSSDFFQTSFTEANNYHKGSRWVSVNEIGTHFGYHPAIEGAVKKAIKWARKNRLISVS